MLRWIGFKKIHATLSVMDTSYVPLILILLFISLVVGTLNIQILLKPLKKEITFSKLFKYYIISWSLGSFVPGKIGEFSIAYFLKKDKIATIGEGTSISLLDKFITLLTLLSIAAGGFFVFFSYGQALRLIMIMIIGLVIMVYSILSERGRSFIRKHILRGFSKYFEGFSKTLFFYLKKQKKVLLLNFLLTLLKWVILALVISFLFVSFNSPMPFIYVLLISVITTIISLVPISISGLGVREASAVYLFSKVGATIVITASVQLINLVIVYSISITTLILFLKELNFIKVIKNRRF
ncbi:flippase-like domain-containing protein [Candidatus Woesearchaeota archaeon]|nr:flippase-like domain-containing protein [Candidatus Woesearchaeota archaeon]